MTPWDDATAGEDAISQLVHLSNLTGADLSLVQPGGGNTSVKVEETDLFGCQTTALIVKGSGTDLRTITPAGFTHLYLDRLTLLQHRDSMSDEEMMELMHACMIFPVRDPVPSVETPLHSLLQFRFVVHTHDVATLSLTCTPSASDHVERLYGAEVAFLQYVRPGFLLARRMAALYGDSPPSPTKALVMEKHGLAAWGDTAGECYENLHAVIEKAEAYVAERATGKRAFGAPAFKPLEGARRREAAAVLLPVIRGELVRQGWPCILYPDASEDAVEAASARQFEDITSRGVMTPEHIMRCGRRALVLSADVIVGANGPSPLTDNVADNIRQQMRRFREEYLTYAKANGQPDPIPDYLKVIAIPSVGVAYAGKDRRSAMIAADCYRATVEAIAGAEAVERFEFLSEAETCEMEYWPLERRKIEEAAGSRRELEGKVALVIGAASGIGRATALCFAAEGAHVALADLDAAGAEKIAGEVNAHAPERAFAVGADVTDAEAVALAVRETVLQFGGIDVLFYSPGVGPRYQSVVDISDEELDQTLAVHFRGAVSATREVARVMLAQGTGGRLIYNASKAAYVPGAGFAAYGASKAALVQYARNVAAELGPRGITANYINADAVDTPLFRGIVKERAARAGKSEAEILEQYAQRSTLGTATVPPEGVAEAALWLASDRSAYTNGCVITVGGGHEGFPR